jgi:hypothetical protein
MLENLFYNHIINPVSRGGIDETNVKDASANIGHAGGRMNLDIKRGEGLKLTQLQKIW